MEKPPLFLVSPSIEKRGVEFHDLSASLSVRYNDAILQAGGLPVTVPTSTDRATLAEAVRRTDGVLLTGGDDINPELYEKKLPRKLAMTVDQTAGRMAGRGTCRELMLIEEVFPSAQAVAGHLPGASDVERGGSAASCWWTFPSSCRMPWNIVEWTNLWI